VVAASAEALKLAVELSDDSDLRVCPQQITGAQDLVEQRVIR